LPDSYLTVAYTLTFTGAGGKTPYAWSVSSGQPPAGLSLSSGGVLQGTATAAGATSFTVQLSDANSVTGSKPVALTVYALPAVTGAAPADGYTGTTYSYAPSTSGGKAPFGWTASGLPGGLTVDANTGAVTGNPSATGVFNAT